MGLGIDSGMDSENDDVEIWMRGVVEQVPVYCFGVVIWLQGMNPDQRVNTKYPVQSN